MGGDTDMRRDAVNDGDGIVKDGCGCGRERWRA